MQNTSTIATPDYLPANYDGNKIVGSIEGVLHTPFNPANAIIFPRSLNSHFAEGADFRGLAYLLKKQLRLEESRCAHLYKSELEYIFESSPKEGITEEISRALDIVLKDMSAVYNPQFRVVTGQGYNRNIVYRPHPDMGAAWRIACCYYGSTTFGYRKEDVYLRTAKLDGEDRPSLYYEPKPDAQPFGFRLFDFWKQAASENPEGVDPFAHFATIDTIRLLMTSANPRLPCV